MDKNNLKKNKTDILSSGLKAGASLIPFVGGTISELIQNVIPSQREDRIVEYLKELTNELEVTREELETKFEDIRYGTFLYNCCKATVNDIYEEKIKYYKKICLDGITGEAPELLKQNTMLNLLLKVDYSEILYLKYYYNVEYMNREVMDEILNELNVQFLKPSYMMNMSQEEINAESYKEIPLNNLFQNGLIENKYNKNGKASIRVTMVGKLLLREIGEANNG